MATLIIRASTATLENSSNTSLSNSYNIFDESSNTSAEFRHTKAGSSTNYLWISGFDFSSIPANTTISEAKAVVEISTRSVASGLYPGFYNNGQQVNLGTFDRPLNDSNLEKIATMTSEDFETFKGYGSNAIIGIPIKRAAQIFPASENIYGVYIEVTYSSTPSSTNNTRVGSSTPNEYYVGSSEVDKIYQGSSLIYEK